MHSEPLQVSIVVGGRFHACHLARELSKQGALHRLVIAATRSKTAAFGIPEERIEPLLWAFLGEKIVRRVTPALAGRFNKVLGKAASRRLGSPNIVHGWAGYCLASFHEAKRRGIACVVERSSAHFLTQIALLQEEYDRLGVPWAQTDPRSHPDVDEYEMADAICVPSLFAMRTFMERGFARERIIYAPLGVNLGHFSPGEKRDSTFRVVYAGRLTIQKGLHHLVSAFRIAGIPDSELRLVGLAGPDTELLLGGDMRGIQHIGRVPEHMLVDHYRQGSVFVLPSVHDGFGMVLAQALACGVPIIGTRNTGAEDLLRMSGERIAISSQGVEEYPAGYVVPIRSPEALATVLSALARDVALLEAKRHAARNLRVAGLGWTDYADRVIAGYQTLNRKGEPA